MCVCYVCTRAYHNHAHEWILELVLISSEQRVAWITNLCPSHMTDILVISQTCLSYKQLVMALFKCN